MKTKHDNSKAGSSKRHPPHRIDVPEDRPEKATNYRELEHLRGSETGERQRAAVPGGWEGTDDATSTAASDIPVNSVEEVETPLSEVALLDVSQLRH